MMTSDSMSDKYEDSIHCNRLSSMEESQRQTERFAQSLHHEVSRTKRSCSDYITFLNARDTYRTTRTPQSSPDTTQSKDHANFAFPEREMSCISTPNTQIPTSLSLWHHLLRHCQQTLRPRRSNLHAHRNSYTAHVHLPVRLTSTFASFLTLALNHNPQLLPTLFILSTSASDPPHPQNTNRTTAQNDREHAQRSRWCWW